MAAPDGAVASRAEASEIRTEDLLWTADETRRRHWILRTVTRRLSKTLLSDSIVKQLDDVPEFRMGVHRVSVLLTDGRVIPDVLISGNRVSWVFGYDTIPFRADQVERVLGTSAW